MHNTASYWLMQIISQIIVLCRLHEADGRTFQSERLGRIMIFGTYVKYESFKTSFGPRFALL